MEFKDLWIDVDEETKWHFKSYTKILHFKRGDKIYSQGENPKGIYFVISGLIGLTIINAKSGKEHLLRFFKQGQFFGHRALFSKESYHGNAISLDSTTIHFISKESIQLELTTNNKFLESVVSVLAKELRRCENQHVMILENQILSRVAQSIVYLKDLHPKHKWTRQEIANFCASTTSTVIKAVTELEKLGLIAQKGREIVIVRRDDLISLQDR